MITGLPKICATVVWVIATFSWVAFQTSLSSIFSWKNSTVIAGTMLKANSPRQPQIGSITR